MPLIGGAISACVGIATFIYIRRGIKVREKDAILRDQEIEMNKQRLKKMAAGDAD